MSDSVYSLPDKITVIDQEYANCRGCKIRVETYLNSVKVWQAAYDQLLKDYGTTIAERDTLKEQARLLEGLLTKEVAENNRLNILIYNLKIYLGDVKWSELVTGKTPPKNAEESV